AASEGCKPARMQVLGSKAPLARLRCRCNVSRRLAGPGGGKSLRHGDLDREELGPIHPSEGNEVAGIVYDGKILGYAHFCRSADSRLDHQLGGGKVNCGLSQHGATPWS